MAEAGAGSTANKRRKTRAEQGACLAKDCIRFHLISTKSDYANSRSEEAFYPDFVEEYFGETGIIYGYEGLLVDVWLHASSFHAFAEVKYDAVVGPARKRHDIQSSLKEIFGAGLVESRDSFLENLSSYGAEFSTMLKTHGETVTSWSRSETSDVSEIVRLELTSPEVKEWHNRSNPLVLMLVEAASPIDDDPLWEVFVAMETSPGSCPRVAGLCNVFRYYHYPDSTRMRIGQILVLPPYQKKQYGFHLLTSVNKVAGSRNCYDVTMEEPSQKLQELRECIDSVRLISCTSVPPRLIAAVESVASRGANRTVLLPPRDLIPIVRSQLKMSEQQFKKCWEFLVFVHLDPLGLGAHDGFRELLKAKLRVELFSDEAKHPRHAHKQVIDTDDSSRAFVMMRFRVAAQQQEQQQERQQEEQQQAEQGLEKLVKERMEEMERMSRRVARLCKAQGLAVNFNTEGWLNS